MIAAWLARLAPRRLRVRIGRGTLHAELLRRDRVLWAAEAGFASPEELAEAIGALTAEPALPRGVRRGLDVELLPPMAQRRTLRALPALRTASLRALVTHQSSRFFRRNGKALVTDARWVSRRRGAPVAEAAAAEEPWLDAILSGAQAAGLTVRTIRPSATRLSLLPLAERQRRAGLRRLSVRRLALVALGCWVGVAVWYLARLHAADRRLRREVAALERPAAAVLAARRELAGAAVMVETIAAAERNRGGFTARLAAVARALPDSAFLTSIELDQRGNGLATGAARQATDVVAALDRGGAVATPRLDGPAVREVVLGRERERFVLRFGADSGRGGRR